MPVSDPVAAGIVGWFLLLSIAGFAAMGSDKSRARSGQWRIPERTLLLLAAAGGATGVLLGMRVFRHKTRHARFVWLVPLFLLLHAAAGWYLFTR